MFSRKRRFYEKKSFYAAVLAAFALVLSIGWWFGGEDVDSSRGSDVQGSSISTADAAKDRETEDPDDRMSEREELDVTVSGAEVVDRPSAEGYLLIEEEGYIRLYQVDALGTRTAVRTTDIRFDLLGSEDQAMFRSGVELKSEEELMELLQDFES